LSGCSARTAPEREQAPGRSVDESAAQSSQAGAGAVDSLPESGGSQEAAQGADSSVPEPALSEPASSSPLEGSEVDAQWNLILVNYQNPIPEDFAPELAEVQNGYKMDARVADIVKTDDCRRERTGRRTDGLFGIPPLFFPETQF
jgi:D-alanyl-D-alanine carboxypeptidase